MIEYECFYTLSNENHKTKDLQQMTEQFQIDVDLLKRELSEHINKEIERFRDEIRKIKEQK